jgi:hypothetical protein
VHEETEAIMGEPIELGVRHCNVRLLGGDSRV